MSASRCTRLLLSLYPRAWRERYGDEFLALVDQTGLTWSVVADVILSAGAQRLRALWVLRAEEAERLLAFRHGQRLPLGDVLLDLFVFLGLVGLVVIGCVAAGAPWPAWNFWFWLTINWHTRYGPSLVSAKKSRAERVGVAYFFFLESLAIIAVIMLAAAALRSRGVPAPPDRADVVFVLCGFAAVCRFGYAWARCASPTTTWPGMSTVELSGWVFLIGISLFTGALAEPNMKMFWILALFPYLMRNFPLGVRPIDIQRRRAVFELEQQRLREKFPVHNFPADWR